MKTKPLNCKNKIKVEGKITTCNGKWMKHMNKEIESKGTELCDNKDCANYYKCLDCGKRYGTHFY